GRGLMKKRNTLLFLSLLSVMMVVSACSDDSEKEKAEQDTDKDELVLAIDAETDDGFDPTTGWGIYGDPLFQSTLLSYDEDFNIKKDLATDYEISDDGLEYVVDIRDDALFSDEEPVTAEDVVFTFETAKESGSVIDLSNLKKVEATDDYQVTFTLKEPDSTFISYLI